VMQGSFDTIKGVTEGIRAMRKATQALATAEAAATTGSHALAGGLKTLKIAALPLMGALGVIAAVGAAFLLLRDKAKMSNEELQDFLQTIIDIEQASNKMVRAHEAAARALDPPKDALAELTKEQDKQIESLKSLAEEQTKIKGREIPAVEPEPELTGMDRLKEYFRPPDLGSALKFAAGEEEAIQKSEAESQEFVNEKREDEIDILKKLSDANTERVDNMKEQIEQIKRIAAADLESLRKRAEGGEDVDAELGALTQETEQSVKSIEDVLRSTFRMLANLRRNLTELEVEAKNSELEDASQ